MTNPTQTLERQRQIRLTLGAAFLLMGFSFTITQTLLVREMMVSFAGNELSIGLVLGSWLLLEAAGSGVLSRLVSRWGRGAVLYPVLQVLFALLLLPVLYLVFGIRHLVGVEAGQGIGLLPILLSSFLLLIPLGLVDGTMFTVGCRAEDEARRGGVRAVSRVYVLEALGGIAGGLIFTYLLIPYLHAVQIALILAVLNLASALSFALLPAPGELATTREGLLKLPRFCGLAGTKRGAIAFSVICLLLLLCLGLLLSPAADAIHRHLVAWQWRGYDLAFYDNSIYGNVAAVRQGEQLTFFANGMPILTTPVPDIVSMEEMVHLPLLFVPQPRRSLVLSGGLGGLIRELLKYPLERIDYAELDPLLIKAVESLPTPLTEAELRDARVHIELVDGRLLVHRLAAVVRERGAQQRQGAGLREGAGAGEAKYDLILVNLPYPTTLQLNRFYTVEFWRLARELLADDGVVVLPAPGSLSYLSPGLKNLHKALHATLAAVFPYVRPIPGDVTLWLASPSEAIMSADVEGLIERWKARGVPSELITDFHIRYKLDDRWLTWFWDSLEGGRPEVENRDLRPSGLLYGLAYWNEIFSPGLARYFDLLSRVSLLTALVPVALLALVGVVIVRLRRGAALPIAIAATGFGGMTADLLIIFAFQVFYGYVYQLIGLLVTAFMAGLSAGGWVMARGRATSAGDRGEWARDRRLFLGLEAGLLAFWLLLPPGQALLYRQGVELLASAVVGPLLVGLNIVAGFLVGAQFPLANRLYLRVHPELSGTAGALYAADLVGAFAAALLVSVVLLPALGMVETCLLVAMLKAVSFGLVWAMGQGR